MKWVRDTSGRFAQRPHYLPTEMDQECERLIEDFLRKRNGTVRFPVETDDLVALVDSLTQDLDLYADLSGEGARVEGVTLFIADQRPVVRVSRDLSEDTRRSNRFRTTLTHELGHVHFHNCLYGLPESGTLFPTEEAAVPSRPSPVCYRDTILGAKPQDWMEWQAGYACGAILMPGSEVLSLVRARVERGQPSQPLRGSLAAGALLREVTKHFDVSEEAAEVRLLKLRHLADGQEAAVLTALP